MNRSQAQIEKRARQQVKNDNTGFEWTLYIDYLTYARARKLVPTISKLEWQSGHDHVTGTTVIEQMRKYLPFAKQKIEEERNISAQRSLRHYVAWFWLIGEDDFSLKIEKYLMEEYADFGRPMLREVEQKLETL